MKKIFTILLMVIALTGCGEKKEEVKKAAYDMLEAHIVQVSDNKYHVSALIENTSDIKLNIYGYTYEIYNKDNKLLINDSVENNADQIKPHTKQIVEFDLTLNYEDVNTIRIYAFDKNKEYITINVEKEKYYKDITDYTNGFTTENNDVIVEINNGDNLKIKQLELIAYADRQPTCVAYVDNPKVLNGEITTIKFTCEKLTSDITEIKLRYH